MLTRTDEEKSISGTVSVIMPAYNAARFVGETIESVLAQTHRPEEIIVVDDGSSDNTLDVLASYGATVRVLQQSNGGPTAARNAGVAIARGEWLAFLDADDLWMPSKLERQLELAQQSAAALIYTDRVNLGERGDLPKIQSDIQPLYEGDVFLDLLLLGNHITLSSVLIRAQVFRSLGGFLLPTVAEDWELWMRVAEEHRIAVCHEPLVAYRFHEGMSSGNPKKMLRGRQLAVESALSLKRGRALPPATRRRVLSATANTNGSDAARRGARLLAVQQFCIALWYWPLDATIYRNLARLVLGRW